MAVHDNPSLVQLVEAVREWLTASAVENSEPFRVYDARVAVKILEMVERQAVLESGHEARHRERLDALGVADDDELAARIRRGDLPDHAFDEIFEALFDATTDRLAVANPSYAAGPGRR